MTGKVPVFEASSSRSSAIVDIDNDGDLDIVTNEMNDRPQILTSDLAGQAGRWVCLFQGPMRPPARATS